MGGPGGRAGMDPAQRLAKMQQELNLTADQTTAIKAIFKEGREKMEALRANTALTPQDQHAQMRVLREEENTKIKAVLTPDQVTKFEAMEAQGRGRRGGGNAPPPAAPQQ
jgi:protein CpxP